MTTLISGGSPVRVGGDSQPFPRGSVPLSQFGLDSMPLIGGDGCTVSYAHLHRTQIWVAVTTNKLTRQVARLPLKVYRRTSNGKERVRTGKLAELMRQPMQGGGPTHFKQALMLPVTVHGNGLVRKIRRGAGRPPESFASVAWHRLRVHQENGCGPVLAWEIINPRSDEPQFIDPADVVHVAWMGLDGPIGLSPLAQLAVTISIEDAAQRYQQSMFKNGARPPSAITADKEFLGLDKDERQALLAQLRQDVNALYVGPENAGRPALLPPGLEWNPVGHTAVEAALIEQRKLTREEVAACYDIPPPLIGMLERSTFNNITELHRMLYVTVLGPWLNLIEETLQAQLIDTEPAFRDGEVWVEFDLGEVLKGDLLSRSQALALQISYGVLTIDEAREIENRTTFGLPETRLPLYMASNLKPVGTNAQAESSGNGSDEASAESVKQAALDVALMGDADVRKLLAASGGSVVEAIFDLAGVSSNGSHSDADDVDGDD